MSEPTRKRQKKTIDSWFSRTGSGSSNPQSAPSITSPNPVEAETEESLPNPQSLEPLNRSNALQRDPGLRCPIWEWSVDEQNRVRKAYIALGPFQPNVVFPMTSFGSQQRRFQYTWFKTYTWLEYSVAIDRAYCFPCFLFDTKDSSNHAFTVEGAQSWNKVYSGNNMFLKHVGSINSSHMAAMQKWDLLRNSDGHIERIIETRTVKDVEDNRLRLTASIESVRLLANQGAPFRGHDESKNSLNRGYFQEVIKSFSRMSVDIERVVLENAPMTAKYTSPSIQKQILGILGNKVRMKIRDEVGSSKYCILVDEAVDTSHREQMAIILRFVDSQGLIRERFFLEECPYAYFVHCFAHRLQLALNTTAQGVKEIWQFFQTLSLIVNFVDSSAKRHSALKEVRMEEIANLVACGELQTGSGSNQLCTLQRAGPTRWSSHFRSIRSLIELFSSTIKTLNDMIDHGNGGQVEAILGALRSFEFVFCLLLMQKVMKVTDFLCQTLQRKSIDFVEAMNFVGLTKSLLQGMREDGWEGLVTEVKAFCGKHDLEMPDLSSRYKSGTGRGCQQQNFISIEHHYKFDVFNVWIDFQLSELNRRFSDQASELLILSSTLDPRDGFHRFNIEDVCKLAKKFYPEDFDDGNMCTLQSECAFFENDMRRDPKFQKLESIADLCHTLVQTRKSEFYPMLYRLICLVLVIPVSTATTERAFSAMNIIKSKLRNKIGDEFLGDCMVLHIEKEYAESIENEDVIKEFEELSTRRVKFS